MMNNVKLIGTLVLAIMVFQTFGAPIASAALIESEAIVYEIQIDDARQKLSTAIERSDVQKALQMSGINPQEAMERVASLSDAEIISLSEKIDQLPAGGSSIVGAAVLIFVVLLVTDILGLTDVFPFVR